MGERTKAERERKRLKLVYGIRSTMARKEDGDARRRRAATTQRQRQKELTNRREENLENSNQIC